MIYLLTCIASTLSLFPEPSSNPPAPSGGRKAKRGFFIKIYFWTVNLSQNYYPLYVVGVHVHTIDLIKKQTQTNNNKQKAKVKNRLPKVTLVNI
jgi:hypothetical protein